MSVAYDKLATQARELLSIKPRPPTEDVAYVMLLEIAEEYEVPKARREDFAERLLPALVSMVSTARSKLVREMEEEAARAYFAKPVRSAVALAEVGAEPRLASPAHALGAGENGQSERDAHIASAVSPAPESDAQASSEAHTTRDAPTPASGGQSVAETQRRDAALPEPEWTEGDQSSYEAQSPDVALSTPASAASFAAESNRASLPTPLSLRAEVLDGWRPLRDELLYVPEYEGVTYGSATARQRERAMTYYHSMAGGFVQKARRMRALHDSIEAAGVATLNELLDRNPTEREP